VWDCTLKLAGEPYMPEGDPDELACQLRAMTGRPEWRLVGATKTLELIPRDNPFQFNLRGNGVGHLECWANGFDVCRGQVVAR
jgi:hypothetical protein